MVEEGPEVRASELSRRVERVLREHVDPELADLAGGVELVRIEEGDIVQVRLLGGCLGCTATTYPLAVLIESRLKSQIPEVRLVEVVP